jgi:hypothetical protein
LHLVLPAPLTHRQNLIFGGSMVTIVSSVAEFNSTAAAMHPCQRYDFVQAGGAVNDDRAAMTAAQTIAPLPTLVFRLALSLRRCGATAEADALFSKSSRMLAEQYVSERLRSSR